MKRERKTALIKAETGLLKRAAVKRVQALPVAVKRVQVKVQAPAPVQVRAARPRLQVTVKRVPLQVPLQAVKRHQAVRLPPFIPTHIARRPVKNRQPVPDAVRQAEAPFRISI